MNNLIFKNWAEINAIKKECVRQKFHKMCFTNPFLLFFHYNGSKVSNWEVLKKKISEQGIRCKGLLVPSHMHSLVFDTHEKTENWRKKSHGRKKERRNIIESDFQLYLQKKHSVNWYALTKGPTLIIGCSSTEEMCAVVQVCTFPTFCCIGGLYKKNKITHLDIKRWISLYQSGEKQVHSALLSSLSYQRARLVQCWENNGSLLFNLRTHSQLTRLFFLLKSLLQKQGNL